MSEHTILHIRNLHKHFKGIYAVNGADFDVERGSITALIGPNGAGKSTIFNLITGYIKADKGSINFEGNSILSLRPDQIANLGISRTFQVIRLFPKMSVMENMLVAFRSQNENLLPSIIKSKYMRKIEKENQFEAMELLKFVDMDVKVNSLAQNLSYGQMKLLEIAQALAPKPELLMLDEPAAGVNPTMLNKIKHLLFELKEQGKTVMFIEHNMDFVMDIADKVVVLDHGDEIAIGTPRQVQSNKLVIEAYLGKGMEKKKMNGDEKEKMKGRRRRQKKQ